MDDADQESVRVTIPDETIRTLEDLYPAALEPAEAVRMAVDDAIHRRRADRDR